MTYQDSCTAKCDDGWTGGTSQATFTCEANGQCSGSQTCQAVSCGPAPSPPHTTGCSGVLEFQDSCTATCENGWTAGSVKSSHYTCGGDGRISGGELSCASLGGYTISGSKQSYVNGNYANVAGKECNGHPVYATEGTGRYSLYVSTPSGQALSSAAHWDVSATADATTCANAGFIFSPYEACNDSPDGSGCAGKWIGTVGCGNDASGDPIKWCTNPDITVVAIHT